jgi:predicted alpha-1,6-mannanase (GH76 family)
MMEDALDKLKLLDYEAKFCQPKRRQPLDRTYFAIPAKNPSVQLQNFLDVVAWLILEITHDENYFKVRRDPSGLPFASLLGLWGLPLT